MTGIEVVFAGGVVLVFALAVWAAWYEAARELVTDDLPERSDWFDVLRAAGVAARQLRGDVRRN